MTTHTSQRGSVLIYAMLTMTAMLAMGLTLTGLFITKLRAASNARNSTIAIYAADSAVEQCLYAARSGNLVGRMQFSIGGSYEVVGSVEGGVDGDITDGCHALNTGAFHFRATGTYRNVRRTLEITQ